VSDASEIETFAVKQRKFVTMIATESRKYLTPSVNSNGMKTLGWNDRRRRTNQTLRGLKYDQSFKNQTLKIKAPTTCHQYRELLRGFSYCRSFILVMHGPHSGIMTQTDADSEVVSRQCALPAFDQTSSR
jgi:hypothetical protein